VKAKTRAGKEQAPTETSSKVKVMKQSKKSNWCAREEFRKKKSTKLQETQATKVVALKMVRSIRL